MNIYIQNTCLLLNSHGGYTLARYCTTLHHTAPHTATHAATHTATHTATLQHCFVQLIVSAVTHGSTAEDASITRGDTISRVNTIDAQHLDTSKGGGLRGALRGEVLKLMLLKAGTSSSIQVCCSVLRCLAECCSVLLCVAECCSVFVAVCCCALLCIAVCCRLLQSGAECCSVLKIVCAVRGDYFVL